MHQNGNNSPPGQLNYSGNGSNYENVDELQIEGKNQRTSKSPSKSRLKLTRYPLNTERNLAFDYSPDGGAGISPGNGLTYVDVNQLQLEIKNQGGQPSQNQGVEYTHIDWQKTKAISILNRQNHHSRQTSTSTSTQTSTQTSTHSEEPERKKASISPIKRFFCIIAKEDDN